MTIASVPFARPAAGGMVLSNTDRRRYARFPISLLGRFMRANKLEYPCKLLDISVGGASIAVAVDVAEGEHIVAYFDHIGGLEGSVARIFEGGFGMAIVATRHKQEKLAAQITWLINRHELSATESRRHDREALVGKSSLLKLAEGIVTQCRVLDFSLSGASIATWARPPFGAEVTLGKLRGVVARHHDRGIGIQFLDIQEPEALRKHFS